MDIYEKFSQGVAAIHKYYQNTHTVTGDEIEIEMDKFIKECNERENTISNVNKGV